MNIALLEDNPGILEYLITLLKLERHLVFPNADAASFLETLWSTSLGKDLSFWPITIDLAIIDLMLPGILSGMDILHVLRETETVLSKLPLIVISGAGQSILDEVHFRFPTVPVLRKPFLRRELLTLIDASSVPQRKHVQVVG